MDNYQSDFKSDYQRDRQSESSGASTEILVNIQDFAQSPKALSDASKCPKQKNYESQISL